MRTSCPLTLAALVTAALVAGCADSPTAVSPDGVRPRASTGPLGVSLTCEVDSSFVTCYAFPIGGSGSGYSFQWTGASNQWDDPESTGYSTAGYRCLSVRYVYAHDITVTVTDGNGATVTEETSVACNSGYWG